MYIRPKGKLMTPKRGFSHRIAGRRDCRDFVGNTADRDFSEYGRAGDGRFLRPARHPHPLVRAADPVRGVGPDYRNRRGRGKPDYPVHHAGSRQAHRERDAGGAGRGYHCAGLFKKERA